MKQNEFFLKKKRIRLDVKELKDLFFKNIL